MNDRRYMDRMKERDIAAQVQRNLDELDKREIERLDREIQQNGRWIIFWRLFGIVSIALIIVAYLVRVLVIG